MKRTLIAACLALGAAATLAAQTPATSGGQGQTGAKPGDATAGGKTVTMRGCLRAGDDSGTFVLANAMSSSAASATTTAAAQEGSGKGQTLRLVGSPAGVNMKDHVGHTVEITGTMAAQGAQSGVQGGTPAGAQGGAKPSTGTQSGAGAGAGSSAGAASGAQQRFNVTAMKHIDAKCGA